MYELNIFIFWEYSITFVNMSLFFWLCPVHSAKFAIMILHNSYKIECLIPKKKFLAKQDLYQYMLIREKAFLYLIFLKVSKHSPFICPKLAIGALEQGVKYGQS